MKKTGFLAIIMCWSVIVSNPIYAGFNAGFQSGVVSYKENGLNHSLLKIGVSPDLEFFGIGVGFDLNSYISLSSKPAPNMMQVFGFRRLAFQRERFGVEWGRISSYSLGYGLLMDRYDSGNFGSSEFITEKAGIAAYANVGDVAVKGLHTNRKVSGGHIDFPVSFLRLGVSYVTDEDGVSDFGVAKPAQSGYSVDLSWPVLNKNLVVYSEYAVLNNHGKGAALGLKGNPISFLEYQVDYRWIGAEFMPGYFGYEYESTPFSFLTQTKPYQTNGLFGRLSIQPKEKTLKGELTYQSYNDIQLLSGLLAWQPLSKLAGSVSYTHSPQSANLGVVNAKIAWLKFLRFPFNSNLELGVNRFYQAPSVYTQTTTVSLQGSF